MYQFEGNSKGFLLDKTRKYHYFFIKYRRPGGYESSACMELRNIKELVIFVHGVMSTMN